MSLDPMNSSTSLSQKISASSSSSSGSPMITKLDQKCARVKSMAFHPTRPWILMTLYSGDIHIWDHKMKVLVDKYENHHDGPVRACAFHPTQPLFATGGDDAAIKVFNYQQRRLLFTLTGHIDYLRHLTFHHEAPWLMSSSDDQTIRIWNWQSRAQVAILTGHSHYVMCAQFHPRDDIVVSASLDQTVRVWDISTARKKHATTTGGTRKSNTDKIELFGSMDGVVRFVLEHERGVNWITFHPTKNVFYSASDDRTIKVWTMSSSTQIINTETLRAHQNNVTCTEVYTRYSDLLLSTSEDRTLRIWDISKRQAAKVIITHRREKDRFWCVASHPTLSLLAAGHDSGFIVFKLEHERIPMAIHGDLVYYIKNKQELRVFSCPSTTVSKNKDELLMTLPKPIDLPTQLSLILSENRFLLSGNDSYTILTPISKTSPSTSGAGFSAIHIGRGRFAILDKSANIIRVMSASDNAPLSTHQSPLNNTIRLLSASINQVILVANKEICFFDFSQEKILGTMKLGGVKFALWSSEGHYCALVSTNAIHILKRTPDRSIIVGRTLREACIKSVCWETTTTGASSTSFPILYYTTPNHLKYALPDNPDEGVICSLDQVIYLTLVRGEQVYGLDRSGSIIMIPIDASEPNFKRALHSSGPHAHAEMQRIIDSGHLIGQAIITYLKNNGHADIALRFVADPKARLELALQSAQLEASMEAAAALDSAEAWSSLADEALRQGNPRVAELALKHQEDYTRLTLLYLCTGNFKELEELALHALNERKDINTALYATMLTGNSSALVDVLLEAKHPIIALAACDTANLTKKAQEISREYPGISISNSISGTVPLKLLENSIKSCFEPWPTTQPIPSFHATYLPVESKPSGIGGEDTFGTTGFGIAQEQVSELNAWETDDLSIHVSTTAPLQEQVAYDPFVDTDGDLATALDEAQAEIFISETTDIKTTEAIYDTQLPDTLTLPHPSNLVSAWLSSTIPVRHVMANSFESARQLLFQQVGVTHFESLEPLFESIKTAAWVKWTTVLDYLNPIEAPASSPSYPNLNCLENKLRQAFSLVTMGKFVEAIPSFRFIIYLCLLSQVEDTHEQSRVFQIITICHDYILGLSMELARKQMEVDQKSLQLGLLFAFLPLKPEHQALAMRNTLTILFKAKCYRSAGLLARTLLSEPLLLKSMKDGEAFVTQLNQLLGICDRSATSTGGIVKDAIPGLLYTDQKRPIDASNYSPITSDEVTISCTICTAVYTKQSVTGQSCSICGLRDISNNSNSTTHTGLCLF